MHLQSLTLRNYRNYAQATANFDPGINVITGRNAQGKTNLLEAVYLLTGARSFRARSDKELVHFGESFAEIDAHIHTQGRNQHVDIFLRPSTRRRITCNDVKSTATELSEKIQAVLFCPDDLHLISEGPAARRGLMDAAISQLRPGYAQLLSEYNRILAHKQHILKHYTENPDLLQPLPEFSDSLCRLTAKLLRYRASYVQRLQETAAPIHAQFSGTDEQLGLRYCTVSSVTNPMASEMQIYTEVVEHLHAHEQAELASGNCLTGAHKDDIEICINGISARSFASQGQTRTAALSLKMAERELFLQYTGQPPILLLDDVLSELDSTRQAFVLNHIQSGQTLITCCEGEDISRRTGGRVITVEQGKINN